MFSRVVHVRKSRLFVALLIFVFFTVSFIFSFLQKSDLYHRSAISPRAQQDALQKVTFAIHKESFGPATTRLFSTAQEDPLQHRSYLISRERCTQKLFLLILVATAPDKIDRRNAIRKTWGSDPSMNIRWKTVFLVGQVKDSLQEKHLEAERSMYNDLIRGAQKDAYQNLTLKTQIGLEWAAKYCDSEFVMKTDDDCFVNPYNLIDYLGSPDIPETKLYLGHANRNGKPHRKGKWAVSMEEYNKTTYPQFCFGVGYVLSADLVLKMVQLFDAKKPLKLEDVYIGTLVEKLGVTNVRHHNGFRGWEYGPCKYFSDTIAYHQASISCMEQLFNLAMKERLEGELKKSTSMKTEENKQLLLPVKHNATGQTE